MNRLSLEDAYSRIRSRIIRTPIIQSELLDRRLGKGHKIYLKCENFQVTRSYKPRGALNALMVKSCNAVIARSSGNFAQALSWAGNQLGIQVFVVMPNDAPKSKIEGTKMWGAKIILESPAYEAQYRKVDELLEENPGAIRLSPFDDYDVISGQGTVAFEALEELESFAHFFAPIGGGGLMAGCAAAVKKKKPQTKIIGVEPEGANDYYLSRKKGEKCSLDNVHTIADGLRSPTVGEKNYPILNEFVDEVRLVSDDDIVKTMKILFETAGIVVEPSGAASLAALVAEPEWEPEGDMLFVISGGNIDPESYIHFTL